jgi:hypothetical protein
MCRQKKNSAEQFHVKTTNVVHYFLINRDDFNNEIGLHCYLKFGFWVFMHFSMSFNNLKKVGGWVIIYFSNLEI